MNYIYLNWVKIESLCLDLAKKIKIDDYKPDLIVGLARGGLLVARLLSDYLEIKEIGILQLEYYKNLNQKKLSPNLINDVSCSVEGKIILLCDDLIDTGGSMQYVLDYIRNRGCYDVRTATLHIKPHSSYTPDYFVEKINAWVVYPWEISETIKKISKNTKSKSELKKMLLNLGIDNQLLKKLFNLIGL